MSWWLRLRALLDGWFAVVAFLLVLALVVGAWGAYAPHVDPGTTTEERVESTWASDGDFEHRATVTEPNPVWGMGTTLENRSVYPVNVAPELNGTFVFGYEASDGGDIDVDVDLTLALRAVEELDEADDEEIVWERTEDLGTASATSQEPGTTVSAPFAFNLSAISNETEEIEESFGRVPGEIETVVQADVDVSGTINGEDVDESWTYSMVLAADNDAFRVEGNPGARDEFASSVQVPVERTYSPTRTVGAPILLLVSLGLLGGLSVAKRRGIALDDHERRYLAYRDDRAEFDEWVSTMSVPDDVAGPPRVEAASLADLVDFAIDTDGGVVYDPDRDEYVVSRDDTSYVYVPPDAPATGGTNASPNSVDSDRNRDLDRGRDLDRDSNGIPSGEQGPDGDDEPDTGSNGDEDATSDD